MTASLNTAAVSALCRPMPQIQAAAVSALCRPMPQIQAAAVSALCRPMPQIQAAAVYALLRPVSVFSVSCALGPLLGPVQAAARTPAVGVICNAGWLMGTVQAAVMAQAMVSSVAATTGPLLGTVQAAARMAMATALSVTTSPLLGRLAINVRQLRDYWIVHARAAALVGPVRAVVGPPAAFMDDVDGAVRLILYQEPVYATALTGMRGCRGYVIRCAVSPTDGVQALPVLRATRTPPLVRRASLLEGTLETTLAPETAGWWLTQLFGAPRTLGGGPYRHIFRAGLPPTGITIEKMLSTRQIERLSGLRVTAAQIDLIPGEPVRLSCSLQGARQQVVQYAIDPVPWDPGHNDWSGAQCVLSQDGIQRGQVTGLRLLIDQGASGTPLALLGKPVGTPRGRLQVRAEIAVVLTTAEPLRAALAGTLSTWEITLTNGRGNGLAGHEQLVITLGSGRLSPLSPVLETASGWLADLSLRVGDLTLVLANPQARVVP